MKIRDIVRPILQEVYQSDGWKMLVCCIMLNLTNRKQVDRVRHELFKRYPTAKDLSVADYEELSELLTPLGMQFKRAATLMKFSKEVGLGGRIIEDKDYLAKYINSPETPFFKKDRIYLT